jgi:hypothetical protein
MRKLMLALVVVAGTALPASAQYTRNVGRDHGQWNYYGYRTTHWCTWSAATVCTQWRARGGRFNCSPGNMSASCQLQRRKEAQAKK